MSVPIGKAFTALPVRMSRFGPFFARRCHGRMAGVAACASFACASFGWGAAGFRPMERLDRPFRVGAGEPGGTAGRER